MENSLNYILSVDGISPKEPLCGGYQGEHRATALVFTPDRDFSEKLSEKSAEGSVLSVRIDFITEAGESFLGEDRGIEALSEPFFIRSEMSASGLDSKVILRINETDPEGNSREFLRATAPLYFMAGEGCLAADDKRKGVDILEKKTAESLSLIGEKTAEAEEMISEGTLRMKALQATCADQLKKAIEAKEGAETSAQAAETAKEISEQAATAAENEALKARDYCLSAGEFCGSAGLEAKAAEAAAERAEAASAAAEEYMSAVSEKQDKFADITERDGIMTLIAGRELRLESIDSTKDFSGYLKLLFGMAELGSYGTVTVSSTVDDVKLSGYRSEYDQANVNVDGCRIRNLAEPIFDKDAVNKAYLDGVVGDIEAALDAVIALQEQYMGGEA